MTLSPLGFGVSHDYIEFHKVIKFARGSAAVSFDEYELLLKGLDEVIRISEIDGELFSESSNIIYIDNSAKYRIKEFSDKNLNKLFDHIYEGSPLKLIYPGYMDYQLFLSRIFAKYYNKSFNCFSISDLRRSIEKAKGKKVIKEFEIRATPSNKVVIELSNIDPNFNQDDELISINGKSVKYLIPNYINLLDSDTVVLKRNDSIMSLIFKPKYIEKKEDFGIQYLDSASIILEVNKIHKNFIDSLNKILIRYQPENYNYYFDFRFYSGGIFNEELNFIKMFFSQDSVCAKLYSTENKLLKRYYSYDSAVFNENTKIILSENSLEAVAFTQSLIKVIKPESFITPKVFASHKILSVAKIKPSEDIFCSYTYGHLKMHDLPLYFPDILKTCEKHVPYDLVGKDLIYFVNNWKCN